MKILDSVVISSRDFQVSAQHCKESANLSKFHSLAIRQSANRSADEKTLLIVLSRSGLHFCNFLCVRVVLVAALTRPQ